MLLSSRNAPEHRFPQKERQERAGKRREQEQTVLCLVGPQLDPTNLGALELVDLLVDVQELITIRGKEGFAARFLHHLTRIFQDLVLAQLPDDTPAEEGFLGLGAVANDNVVEPYSIGSGVATGFHWVHARVVL